MEALFWPETAPIGRKNCLAEYRFYIRPTEWDKFNRFAWTQYIEDHGGIISNSNGNYKEDIRTYVVNPISAYTKGLKNVWGTIAFGGLDLKELVRFTIDQVTGPPHICCKKRKTEPSPRVRLKSLFALAAGVVTTVDLACLPKNLRGEAMGHWLDANCATCESFFCE